MAEQQLPSPSVLRNILRYDPDLGLLFWRPRSADMFDNRNGEASRRASAWNTKHAGEEAFRNCAVYGYRTGSIFNKSYRAHRVAWAIYYGEWPSKEVDHINNVRDDNRIINLRLACRAENNRNTRPVINSSSRFLGVSWNRKTKVWHASIRAGGKQRHLGCFRDEVDAARAYDAAAAKHHGEFSNLNFPCA